VLKAFENNPEKVALAVFKVKAIRCMELFQAPDNAHDTEDARGFRQWQKVGRRVKRGQRHSTSSLPSERKYP